MTILSIDLAYKQYKDIGVVAISKSDIAFRCDLLPPPTLSGSPDPPRLAEWLLDLAKGRDASCMMLDGPQAWKDPANGLTHSRICERELNAPAKTGLPGCAKPGNYLPFIEFSIAVFCCLEQAGWPRLGTFSQQPDVHPMFPCTIESLPLAAWRALDLQILPAKKKARSADLADRLGQLRKIYPLSLSVEAPSHDQLQALVSGLGAASYAFGNRNRIRLAGVAPTLLAGNIREGYILNPSFV